MEICLQESTILPWSSTWHTKSWKSGTVWVVMTGSVGVTIFRTPLGRLKRWLRHEPENSLLTQGLEKRELDLAKEQDIHDSMNMADRLDPESDIEILKWVWNQRE